MADEDLIAKNDGILKVEHLRKPDLDLEFKRNADGTYRVGIPLSESGNPDEIPLLRVAEKNLGKLQAAVNNALLEEGIPTKLGKINAEVSGELSGKTTLGGEINGESGKALSLTAAKVNGVVNGEGEIGGKIAGNLKMEIQPGTSGLSGELQTRLQGVLDRKCDEIYGNWVEDMAGRGGALIDLGPGQPSLKVTPGALSDYMEENKSMVEKFKGIFKSTDAGHDTPERIAGGFEAPNHPYHRMYNDTNGKLGEMAPQLGGQHATETLAAALTLSAANAKFDPTKPIEIVAGRHENTLFAVQGDPTCPASKSAMIDIANLKTPTAEQVSQLQSQNTPEPQQIAALERNGPSRS